MTSLPPALATAIILGAAAITGYLVWWVMFVAWARRHARRDGAAPGLWLLRRGQVPARLILPLLGLMAGFGASPLPPPLWDGRAWNVQVTDATERTLQLRAPVSAADSGSLWDLRCAVREGLLVFLRENYPGSLPRSRLEVS